MPIDQLSGILPASKTRLKIFLKYFCSTSRVITFLS